MIYLDNSATSFKKPKSVIKAVDFALKHYSANPGRSGHALSLDAANCVYECRYEAANFFHVGDCKNVIFTSNATDALNLAIKGILTQDSHVILSSLEHNSVLRPIKKLENIGVFYDILQADANGVIHPEDFLKLIRPNTKLVVMTHASNVCGNILPVQEVLEIAHEHGILFLLDAAQTAGIESIHLDELPFDFVATSGHKGLLGPQGTGLLLIHNDTMLETLKEGGTGSNSESEYQPDYLPDRYESGTLNTPGIAGLCAGIRYVSKHEKHIAEKENWLNDYFTQGVQKINGLMVYGDLRPNKKRAPITAINLPNLDSVTVSNLLSTNYEIAVRGGLHCSYLAHKTFQTLGTGIVRFSFSHYNKKHEVDEALCALKEIAKL